MASFRGLLTVEGDPESELIADIDVSQGHIRLVAGGSEIANWDLNDISIEESGGVFRIVADGEALLLQLSDAKRFAGTVGVAYTSPDEALIPRVVPVPEQRAPEDAPSILDEPLEMAATPSPTAPSRPRPMKTGPDETPLARHLSWALVGVAVIFFVGAIFDWGSYRLTDSNFPIARVLIVIAGFAALAAAYLGLALEKRRDVALVATISGLISALTLVLYSRRAGIGYGYIVTILGTAAVISVTVLALSHLGAPPPDETDQ
jgi:hypothetical protein